MSPAKKTTSNRKTGATSAAKQAAKPKKKVVTKKKPANKKSAPANAKKKAAAKTKPVPRPAPAKKQSPPKTKAPAPEKAAKLPPAKKKKKDATHHAAAAATSDERSATRRKARPKPVRSPAADILPRRTPIVAVHERSPKLGDRWACYQCGSKFYDMGKEEPECPKCGANQLDAPKIDPRAKPTTPPAPKKKKARAHGAMSPLLDDEDDAAYIDDAQGGLDLGITAVDDDDFIEPTGDLAIGDDLEEEEEEA